MASKRRRPSHHASGYAPERQVPPSDERLSTPPEETASPPPPRPVIQERDRVGDILRRVREHRGEDLESISDYLRIRPSFLFALENSRYDELPADAYVIGFLRTYALYLGLDGRGAIDQYRREMAGRRKKPQLSMPQPMSEGRTPTIAVLIGAAVVCLLIYGLWYGLATPDREIIEKPLELPQTAAQAEGSSPASEALAATAAGDLLLETTTGASEAVSALAAQQEPKQESKATEKQEAKPETKAPAKEEPKKEEAKKEEPKKQEIPESQPQTTTEPPKPQTFGETGGKSRVSIKAEAESWIMVTDSKGVTVFERTLKPGEVYHVPSGKGLSLTTGNAAGVTLTLDGAALPKIGKTDRVMRGVSLDPDKMKARGEEKPQTNATEGNKPSEEPSPPPQEKKED